MPGPTLHLGCMPFPTPQGTQAAVAAMLAALHGAGREAHLLTYAGGCGEVAPTHVQHRLADFPRVRSQRSGPSLGKLVLDGRMVGALRRLHRITAPTAVVAHNVEAAVVAAAAGVGPRLYFAHTRFAAELPFYAAPRLAPALRAAGAALDARAISGAHATVAIAPSLADELGAAHAIEIPTLLPPWPVPPALDAAERAEARARLHLPPHAPVALYAGNLDRYQGWEDVVAAIEATPNAHLLLATASALPRPLRACRLAAEGRLWPMRLGTESERRLAHAAADVALIPRRAPGGLPIKLLDALSRGVPTVATRRATAGLALGGAAVIVEDDAPRALAEGLHRALGRPELAEAGRAYVRRAHAPEGFVAGLEDAVERARRAA